MKTKIEINSNELSSILGGGENFDSLARDVGQFEGGRLAALIKPNPVAVLILGPTYPVYAFGVGLWAAFQ